MGADGLERYGFGVEIAGSTGPPVEEPPAVVDPAAGDPAALVPDAPPAVAAGTVAGSLVTGDVAPVPWAPVVLVLLDITQVADPVMTVVAPEAPAPEAAPEASVPEVAPPLAFAGGNVTTQVRPELAAAGSTLAVTPPQT